MAATIVGRRCIPRTAGASGSVEKLVGRTPQRTAGTDRGTPERRRTPSALTSRFTARPRRARTAITSAGQQDDQHLLFVLGAKRPWIERQQSPLATLQAHLIGHLAREVRSSRIIAASALERKRSASSASRSLPAGVSR